MAPPLVCPQPPDCPLYDKRLVVRQDETLRLAILAEGRPGPDLAGLVRAEALRAGRPQALLLPAPESAPPLFVEQHQKEAQHEQIARPSD